MRIEAGRVRSIRIDDVIEVLKFVAPDLAFELPDPGIQPIPVSSHRIDFPIVAEHPKRLRKAHVGKVFVEKRW